MASADEAKLDPAVVAALYVEHAEELRYFITGVLRNPDLAVDVLQNTFSKAMEFGHGVQQQSLKAWLFRVAYNEAMLFRRREAVGERANRKLAEESPRMESPPDAPLHRWEAVQAVREALQRLPAEQQQVVQMRIYEQKRFCEIAAELNLPLGTVLSRMQLAQKKLRGMLHKNYGDSPDARSRADLDSSVKLEPPVPTNTPATEPQRPPR